MKKMQSFLVFCYCLFIPLASPAAGIDYSQKVSNYFRTIHRDSAKLSAFLLKMPKGGDLHNHFSGAAYAESLIRISAEPLFCIDEKTFEVTISSIACSGLSLDKIENIPSVYKQAIQAWSMHEFQSSHESGHDHFFAAFAKFDKIVKRKRAPILAEILRHAGNQGISYVELMITPGDKAVTELGAKLGWDNNLSVMRERLLANGLKDILRDITQEFSQIETAARRQLACDTASAKVGCDVKVRFIAQAARVKPPEQVFAQLLTGFELSKIDPRFVGVNIVQPEDNPIAIRDYQKHMLMFDFLHSIYPAVNISMHAGELSPSLVEHKELTFHINDAIKIGHAKRIGHGVSIAYENNAHDLLRRMAQQRIFVEINLTSNKAILDVKGRDHPFLLYLRYGVPMALSTDDAGVLRTDLTREYVTATMDYGLSYEALKQLVRNSLTYSFLPGESLWQNEASLRPVSVCSQAKPIWQEKLPPACVAFLQKNEKAQLQRQLEKKLAEFEKNIMEQSV